MTVVEGMLRQKAKRAALEAYQKGVCMGMGECDRCGELKMTVSAFAMPGGYIKLCEECWMRARGYHA